MEIDNNKNTRDNHLKIVHILSGDTFGGAEAQILCFLEGLNQLKQDKNYNLKIQVEIIIFNNGILYEKLNYINKNSNNLIITKLISEASFFNLLKNITISIKNSNPQIIISHGYKESLVGFIAAKLNNKKWIHFFHGGTENYKGFKFFKWIIYKNIESILSRYFSDKIVSVSSHLAKNLNLSHLRKVKIIHNSASRNRTLDRESSISSNIKILWIGRFVPVKRPDFAVKVYNLFSNYKGILPHFPTFTMAGEGPLLVKTKEDSKNKILFPGFLKNIHETLTGNCIILLTSDSEGIPTVVLEGMHNKSIIISRKLKGVEEISKIIPSYPILIPEEDNELEMSKLLLYAVNNFNHLSQKARNLNTDYFSESELAKRHINLYFDLLH